MKPDQLMTKAVTEYLTEATPFSGAEAVSKVIGYLRESKQMEALAEDGDSTYIVTMRDLLNLNSLNTKVSTIMHQVPRLGPNNTVSDAATLMHEFRTRSMPVYKGKKLIARSHRHQ